jgi:hypothetical protein
MVEIDVRALSYLMTAVIHRLHEKDPGWWREFLGEIKAQRNTVGGAAMQTEEVLQKAIAIVEHALKPESPMAARSGQ